MLTLFCVYLQNAEKLAEPPIISALISIVIATRNKLNAMSFAVPKDPFFYPRRFTRTLALFVNQRLAHHPISANSHSPASTTSVGAGVGAPVFCHHAYLNITLVERIDLAFEKHRAADAYKLHRVVLNKLDDLTAATTTAIASASSKSGLSHAHGHGHTRALSLTGRERDAEALMEGTTDLAAFVGTLTGASGRAGPGAPSVKCLWMGRLELLERKRVEGVLSDAEEERERERERERSDFSDEDGENPFRMPWSNKVQKKLEGWAGCVDSPFLLPFEVLERICRSLDIADGVLTLLALIRNAKRADNLRCVRSTGASLGDRGRSRPVSICQLRRRAPRRAMAGDGLHLTCRLLLFLGMFVFVSILEGEGNTDYCSLYVGIRMTRARDLVAVRLRRYVGLSISYTYHLTH